MTVRIEKEAAVTTIIVDRAERRNAIDPATAEALRSAFSDFEDDPFALVAVLTGAGSHFCAGFDLKAFASTSEDEFAYDPLGPGPMGPTRQLLSKPVIAAIEGYAVAGGMELALWCDLRVVAQTATFGVFCRRWGVPLIDGGTVRLPRIIGQGRALDLILTGRPVGAQEAMEIGLANRVVPEGHALREAVALAGELARFPSLCLQVDRMSAYRGWDKDLGSALLAEAEAGKAAVLSGARDGASRFAGGMGRGGDFEKI